MSQREYTGYTKCTYNSPGSEAASNLNGCDPDPNVQCTVHTTGVHHSQTAIFLYTVYCCHSVHSSSAFTEGGSSGPLAEMEMDNEM